MATLRWKASTKLSLADSSLVLRHFERFGRVLHFRHSRRYLQGPLGLGAVVYGDRASAEACLAHGRVSNPVDSSIRKAGDGNGSESVAQDQNADGAATTHASTVHDLSSIFAQSTSSDADTSTASPAGGGREVSLAVSDLGISPRQGQMESFLLGLARPGRRHYLLNVRWWSSLTSTSPASAVDASTADAGGVRYFPGYTSHLQHRTFPQLAARAEEAWRQIDGVKRERYRQRRDN